MVQRQVLLKDSGHQAFDELDATDLPSLAATYQPLDSDLTAIAALSTTAYGRGLLALADAAAGLTALGAQPVDSDLTSIAALTTTAYGRAFLALADAAAGRTALGVDEPTGIKVATIPLSSADILGLATTDVPAIDVGAGQAPVVFGMSAVFTPVSIPYAISTGSLILGVHGNGPVSVALTGLIDQVAKTTLYLAGGGGSSIVQPASGALGADWVLWSDEAPTLGNGTMSVKIWYALIG